MLRRAPHKYELKSLKICKMSFVEYFIDFIYGNIMGHLGSRFNFQKVTSNCKLKGNNFLQYQ